MKKKRKLKNKFKVLIVVLLLVAILTTSITIYKKCTKKEQEVPNNNLTIDDFTISSLRELNFSDEDITKIKQYVSEDNITYIINNELDNNTVMSFINETYYIDDYLEKYLNYYNNNNNVSYKEIVTIINTHIDSEFYTNSIDTDTSLGKYVILNKYYHADGTYKGENLVIVDKQYSLYNIDMQLSKECFDAFLKMYNAAKEVGLEFKINSAYRSFEKQVNIYNGWVSKDGQSLADTYSARAGYSEHQTGFAFDVRDYPKTTDYFQNTEEFTWLKDNAHKYGFIIRFPEGKEYITGYQYEPWHYRYCGIDCATYIYNNNITFEEYYEYFIKYNNPKNLS